MKIVFKNIITWIFSIRARKILDTDNPNIFLLIGGSVRSIFRDEITEVISQNGNNVISNKPGYNYKLGFALNILGLKSGFSNPIKWIHNVFKASPQKRPLGFVVQEFSFSKDLDDGSYIRKIKNVNVVIITDIELSKRIRGMEKDEYYGELGRFISSLSENTVVYLPIGFTPFPNTNATLFTFGYEEVSDIRILDVADSEEGQSFTYEILGEEGSGYMNKFGDHYIYSNLIAKHAIKQCENV